VFAAEAECAAVGERQEIGERPLDDAQSVGGQVEIPDDVRVEQADGIDPGWNSSVTAAPPTTGRRSITATLSPAPAREAAQTRPLWPAPMTMASKLSDSAKAASGTVGLQARNVP